MRVSLLKEVIHLGEVITFAYQQNIILYEDQLWQQQHAHNTETVA